MSLPLVVFRVSVDAENSIKVARLEPLGACTATLLYFKFGVSSSSLRG